MIYNHPFSVFIHIDKQEVEIQCEAFKATDHSYNVRFQAVGKHKELSALEEEVFNLRVDIVPPGVEIFSYNTDVADELKQFQDKAVHEIRHYILMY